LPLADLAARQNAHGVMTMNEMVDRWLSITEICKHLGASNDTVYKWVHKHDISVSRMGRLWKFKKNEVDECMKAGGASTPRNSYENE
jgi:excisionase family DNA binding protein